MTFEPILKGQAASVHGSRCLPFGRFCSYRKEEDKLTSDLLLLGCVVQATRVELTRSVASTNRVHAKTEIASSTSHVVEVLRTDAKI